MKQKDGIFQKRLVQLFPFTLEGAWKKRFAKDEKI